MIEFAGSLFVLVGGALAVAVLLGAAVSAVLAYSRHQRASSTTAEEILERGALGREIGARFAGLERRLSALERQLENGDGNRVAP